MIESVCLPARFCSIGSYRVSILNSFGGVSVSAGVLVEWWSEESDTRWPISDSRLKEGERNYGYQAGERLLQAEAAYAGHNTNTRQTTATRPAGNSPIPIAPEAASVQGFPGSAATARAATRARAVLAGHYRQVVLQRREGGSCQPNLPWSCLFWIGLDPCSGLGACVCKYCD